MILPLIGKQKATKEVFYMNDSSTVADTMKNAENGPQIEGIGFLEFRVFE